MLGKRIFSICLLLFIMTAFSGCGEASPKRTLAELSYLYYPGVSWELPPKEFFSACGLDAEKFSLEEKKEAEIGRTVYYMGETEFLSQPVTMVLTFSSPPFGEALTLRQVSLRIETPFSEEDFQSVCTKLSKLSAEQGAKTDSPEVTEDGQYRQWVLPSSATTSDSPPAFREKVNSFGDYVWERQGSQLKRHAGQEFLDMFGERHLSVITADYDGETGQTVVNFDGRVVAGDFAYAKAWDQLEKDKVK